MLRALGVPGQRIPGELDDRAALFRTLLAGQRLLIVLDNAATEGQVAPLIPGAPGCLVLITSRRRLAGLETTGTVSLDPLPPGDAAALFARTAGENRVADQPPASIAEVVDLCGRLPLAIRIVAARLRSRPAWTLTHLIDRLKDERHRLTELETGHRSITATLDLSYQHLSLDLQRMFRMLGLHPGADIAIHAAAALADTTIPAATRQLEDLVDCHLLQSSVPNRYRLHDLLRAYARAAAQDESQPDRLAAVTRLLDHYRHTTSVTMDLLHPYERERRPAVPPAVTPPRTCPIRSVPPPGSTPSFPTFSPRRDTPPHTAGPNISCTCRPPCTAT